MYNETLSSLFADLSIYRRFVYLSICFLSQRYDASKLFNREMGYGKDFK